MDPGTKAQLYTELLNKYIFFYEKGHTGINDEILQELIKRVQVIRECWQCEKIPVLINKVITYNCQLITRLGECPFLGHPKLVWFSDVSKKPD